MRDVEQGASRGRKVGHGNGQGYPKGTVRRERRRVYAASPGTAFAHLGARVPLLPRMRTAGTGRHRGSRPSGGPLQVIIREERDTMDDEKHRQQSEQSRLESSLLKLHEEFHQLIQECHECQREIEPHWQVCAHCGVRLATHCPGCCNPLPPAGAHACPRCGLALPQGQP